MISLTPQTMQRSSLAVVVAVAVMTVACGANSPIGPETVSRASTPVLADTTPTGTVSATMKPQGLFPPIDPPGISCPSDAPQIRVGSIGSRLDVDFSEIKGTIAYEIEIRDSGGNVAALLKVDAPANHAEWRGGNGAYLVRVRSRNCGGFGNWSEAAFHHVQGGVLVDEGCNMKPEFEVTQDVFTFWPAGDMRDSDVTVRFSNGGGTWRVELVTSDDDLASDTDLERQTGGTWLDNANVHVACGETASRHVHEGLHPWRYWWYRIYRDGVLLFTSPRKQL